MNDPRGRPRSAAERLLRAARLRIGIVTASGFLVVTVLSGVFASLAAVRVIGQSDDRLLVESAGAAATWLIEPVGDSNRINEVLGYTAVSGQPPRLADLPGRASGTFLYLLDPAGAPLVSPSFGALEAFDAADATGVADADGIDVRDALIRLDGEPVAVRVATIAVRPPDSDPVAYVQAALPRHDLAAERAGVIYAILAAGFISLLLGLVVSLEVTRRALVPVQWAFERERRLISDASHEIRTPVAVIGSAAELLELEGQVLPDGLPLLADIRAETARLRRLVGELLDLSRLDSPRGPRLALASVRLDALLGDVVRMGGAMAPDGRSVRIGSAEALEARIDIDRITGLLTALVENALRYSPDGGEVVLGVRRAGRWAEITIDDAGPGIPADQRDRLFIPFARLEAGAGDTRGTGLGLAISRTVAEAHGGTLTIDDAPMGGARLLLRLPLA